MYNKILEMVLMVFQPFYCNWNILSVFYQLFMNVQYRNFIQFISIDSLKANQTSK